MPGAHALGCNPTEKDQPIMFDINATAGLIA